LRTTASKEVVSVFLCGEETYTDYSCKAPPVTVVCVVKLMIGFAQKVESAEGAQI